jgi:hypothetical protein
VLEKVPNRLQLKLDEMLFSFASNFNLRPCIVKGTMRRGSSCGADAGGGAVDGLD